MSQIISTMLQSLSMEMIINQAVNISKYEPWILLMKVALIITFNTYIKLIASRDEGTKSHISRKSQESSCSFKFSLSVEKNISDRNS